MNDRPVPKPRKINLNEPSSLCLKANQASKVVDGSERVAEKNVYMEKLPSSHTGEDPSSSREKTSKHTPLRKYTIPQKRLQKEEVMYVSTSRGSSSPFRSSERFPTPQSNWRSSSPTRARDFTQKESHPKPRRSTSQYIKEPQLKDFRRRRRPLQKEGGPFLKQFPQNRKIERDQFNLQKTKAGVEQNLSKKVSNDENIRGKRENLEENKIPSIESKPIAYGAIDDMIKDEAMDVNHVALRLSTESCGFDLLLKTHLNKGWIRLILLLMNKLCSANKPSLHLNQVLFTLLKNDFELKIMKYLTEIFAKRALGDAEDAATQVSNCLHLMRGWLIYIQNSAEQAVQVLFSYIKAMVAQHTLGDYYNIEERLQEIDDLLLKCYSQPKAAKQSASKDGHIDDEQEAEAPDDFRKISVFPTNDDIKVTQNPFVRRNLIGSAYTSTDHYLDVQFRLLREDFIRPLREGINEYNNPDTKAIGQSKKKKKRYQGMKVYENVAIAYPKLNEKGIHYCLQFDTSRLKNVQWQNSKRLLYGNLICLSSDNFQSDLLFATISNRDNNELNNGYIQVEFINFESNPAANVEVEEEDDNEEENGEETGLISLQDMKKIYCMVESEAYFEAYQHVLAALQDIEEIPLGRYIVQCQPDLRPPQYLQKFGKQATYNFSSILGDNESEKLKSYCLLDTDSWPEAKELGLDSSQVKALQSALTNELSIVQGPPGTGKTHVGLMIMKMLLGNKDESRNKRNGNASANTAENKAVVPDGPILIVCFTNHALDQFLEGIAKFHPKGLVRVGGRCKTESLKKYILSCVRRERCPDLTKNLKRTVWDVRRELDDLVSAMEESEEALKESTRSILSLECLKQVILPRHIDQLQTFGKGKDDDMLLNWLGVKKRTSSLPEDFDLDYVVEETVNVIAHLLQHRAGFNKNDVVVAANATGCLDEDIIIRWLYTHRVHSYQESIDSDIVLSFLQRLYISFNPRDLIKMGFHPLEVNCAWLVCAVSYGEEYVEERMVFDWLDEKKGSLNPITNSPQAVDEIEQLSDYLQEQRMIDMENDDKLQFIRPDEKRQNRYSQRKKKKVVAVEHDKLGIVEEPSYLEDGYQFQRPERQRRKRALIKQLKSELYKSDTMTDDEANSVSNLCHLTTAEKWNLYRYWVSTLRTKLRKTLTAHAGKYNRLAKALAEIRSQEDLSVLMNADVVAMTTTGAAKYRHMISKLPVKVIIVEEAAEVLEAHIVTTMPKSTEHLILIGDHQQLKPSPTVYELALKFNLDTSLFERLVKNGIPCTRLTLQHRMRPRIADLIRPHIYKELNDHESVLKYENVCGIQKNVFFVSHKHEEDHILDSTSKANQYEADFIVGLCKYLLQQGYLPDQIIILTAYVGQLFAFKKILASKLKDKKVRVTAVDNFQGEENDIILLSLVRSNAEGKIGFLSIENRVCVALSRAKKGLYCIGNFDMLKSRSELWRKILKSLKEDEIVGEALTLQCKNHEDKKLQVKDVKDFQNFPEGGCGQPCRFRLDCGHVCTRFCHPDDEEHKTFTCRKPCEKLCPVGHVMHTQCSVNPQCRTKVDKVVSKCGHLQEVFCFEDPKRVTCQTPCTKTLSCGHSCKDVCGNPCPKRCTVEVEVQRECGHVCKLPCADSKNVTAKKCKEKCNEVLKCGHVCKGTCGRCNQGRLHTGCSNQTCGRVLCCGHICKENCSSLCPPCREKCKTSCQHSSCERPCHMPCMLCKEKCTWKCQHYKCSKLCSEPCDRPRCDEPCTKKLLCKHPCIGLCGEPCPKLCRVCHKKDVTEIFFGDEDEENARFVQLECGHIFTYQNLDKWMEQKTVNEGSEIDIKLKECPRCKTPIRRSTRYGEIVNKQLMLINEVRKRISGEPSEVQKCHEELLLAITIDDRIDNYFPLRAEQLEDEMKSALSLPALRAIETKSTCLEEFSSIKELMRKRKTRASLDLNSTMNDIVEWLFWKRSYFSEQEEEDLHLERQRCKDGLKLFQLQCEVKASEQNIDSSIKSHLARIHTFLYSDLSPYHNAKQESVQVLFEKIEELLPNVVPGLGITDDERKMILGAIELKKGHWYSCQNGHVYCIGECGGAVVEAKCPYCKETIG